MKRPHNLDAAPRPRLVDVDAARDPTDEAIEWSVQNERVEAFLTAAKARDRRGLNFKVMAPEKLAFFIAVLPLCPQIESIDLPIPVTYGQTTALANALARNSGLQRLQLHVCEKAAPDSTVLDWFFAHHTERAATLSELWIHIHARPAGDTDWIRPLCDALSKHLKAESVRLTLPWTDGNLKLLGEKIRTNPFVLSLTVGGEPTGFGMQQLVDELAHEGCRLKSLSFPDSCFDEKLVADVVNAIERNQSLVKLDLGRTEVTHGQWNAIDEALARNRNLVTWQYLGGSWPV